MNTTPFYFPNDDAGAGSGRTGPARDPDEAHALSIAPLGKEIADYVADRLPPGTEFGVFIQDKQAGRVIAITSNRQRMVPLIASWLSEMIDTMKGKSNAKQLHVAKVPWDKVPKSS